MKNKKQNSSNKKRQANTIDWRPALENSRGLMILMYVIYKKKKFSNQEVIEV